MINRVILVGRITKDPEMKSTQSNIPVVSFTIAVNRQFKSENGENDTDFIQCVVWRKQAENMAKYVSKGNLIGIDGRIQTRNYETEHGTKYITEVVCDNVQYLESKKEDSEFNQEQYKQVERLANGKGSSMMEEETKSAVEEDLPF